MSLAFTPPSLEDSGMTLRIVLSLPLPFLCQTPLEIYKQNLRVLTTGLEADLNVDTHPLFCFTCGKWSGGQRRQWLRPLLGGLSTGRRVRPGLRDI